MENASKALIMAAGVLIGILIISLAVYLFVDFGSTSAEINAQNAEKQITQFNSKFTSYADKELTIYDVITVVNYAKENNKYYDGLKEYQITVYLNNVDLTNPDRDEQYLNTLISSDKNSIQGNPPKLPGYVCKSGSIKYNQNGRVKSLSFTNN